MVFEILLIILGFCFLVVGLVGCVLPAIPGPPLSFAALLLIHVTRFSDFSNNFLVIAGIVVIAVTVIDYIIPVWGTKKWGGSRAGVIGSVIGLLGGLFFPPWGIIAGPFAGAVVGELVSGRNAKDAIRSGFGSFVGFIFGTVMKLTVCLVFTYHYFYELITSVYSLYFQS